MAYTQADADAAKAKIDADTATLATQTQALTDAQAQLGTAQAAVTSYAAAVNAAQDAITATKADIATEQAIVDAFNAQPAPPPSTHTLPTVSPAAPKLSAPYVMTSTKVLSGTAAQSFANRTSKLGRSYKLDDTSAHLPSLSITDHDCSGGAGVLRIQNGVVDGGEMSRIKMLNAQYDPGVMCGLLHVGHGTLNNFTMQDCDYDRSEYVTDSGDIYAAVFTGGGHTKTGALYGFGKNLTFRNIRARHAMTAYTGSSVGDYQNSDIWCAEAGFSDILIDGCDFQYAADACVDRKSPRTRIQNTILGYARENDKLWCPADDGAIFSLFPRHAHVVVTPQPQYGRIPYHCEYRQFAGSDPKIPLFDIQRAGWNAVYDTVDLTRLPSGQVLAICESSAYGSTIDLGGKKYTISKGTVLL